MFLEASTVFEKFSENRLLVSIVFEFVGKLFKLDDIYSDDASDRGACDTETRLCVCYPLTVLCFMVVGVVGGGVARVG